VALRKKGKYWYGDSQADIPAELARFGKKNGYEPTQFADAVCGCGNRTFELGTDEDQGAAVRTCSKCDERHPIGDSGEYLDDAELMQSICRCDGEAFEITVGVALYEGSDDVRWLYLGCRCPACGLVGCYGDWKNEFEDYRELLKRV